LQRSESLLDTVFSISKTRIGYGCLDTT